MSPGDNGHGPPHHIYLECHGGMSDCRVAGLGGELGLHRGNAPLMVLMFLLTFYSVAVDAGPGLCSSLIMSHPGRVGLY